MAPAVLPPLSTTHHQNITCERSTTSDTWQKSPNSSPIESSKGPRDHRRLKCGHDSAIRVRPVCDILLRRGQEGHRASVFFLATSLPRKRRHATMDRTRLARLYGSNQKDASAVAQEQRVLKTHPTKPPTHMSWKRLRHAQAGRRMP